FCFQSLSSIRDESELTNFEIKTAEYSEDITELANVLMTLEMQLVEQLECRDLENHHHEKLLEIAISTLEKIVKGELDEDLPDAVRSDTIVNAVGASHDIHLLKIDNREDELVTKVNSWCAHLVDKLASSESDS
ncbi:Dynein regulatory complex subunit 3, partial [Eschrichtius robustus]|nr:Dynein regulatory complex subunit 3 [Eschrichtius robustus]